MLFIVLFIVFITEKITNHCSYAKDYKFSFIYHFNNHIV